MSLRYALSIGLLALILPSPAPANGAEPSEPANQVAATNAAEIPVRIGGAGGAYFLAEPGPLIVDVQKRERRAGRHELQAILVGPDRAVLDRATIRDDNESRPIRLKTLVLRKGLYALNVTVSQDRYGETVWWGLRTNCPKYLIETARGHRDERHQEPIVLGGPDRSGDVCFQPRDGALSVEISGLPKAVRNVSMFDGEGQRIQQIPVDSAGRAAHTFPPAVHRQAVPWRLRLPVQQATIHADGLTRWEANDPCPDSALWTPQAASFFPLAAYRWLLTPSSRTVYVRPGEQGEIALTVHNNAPQKRNVRLDVEFPAAPWPVHLSAHQVPLPPKASAQVRVQFPAPPEGQTWICYVRATPAEDPQFTTYSTLQVRGGAAPASRDLTIPLTLQPYRHENEQFGHLPDYPVESQFYFDTKNRPWARLSHGVAVLREGKWAVAETAGAASTKLAFDRDGDAYCLAHAGRHGELLHSADGGKTFTAYPIPQDGPRGSMEIEQFSGHNTPDGPPPLLRYVQTQADPRRIWRRLNDLYLILPRKEAGRIVFDKPILISRKCIGYSGHSGMPSSVVSRGTMVHVVWAEATDPDQKGIPGVPTFVASYDRRSGTLGEPALVAYGPPANDVHNTPSITIDSRGYLHVLAGTHGQPFPYSRSLQPNTASAGWTKSEAVAAKHQQTYIGLVCGPDDTLHLVFRLWRNGEAPFPASHYAALAYQRKPANGPWESPRVLIVPPFSEYSVYYHRLTIDRIGRLFLSYDYWSTHWFYRNDQYDSRRAVMMSPDGGKRWKLVQTADLQGGQLP